MLIVVNVIGVVVVVLFCCVYLGRQLDQYLKVNHPAEDGTSIANLLRDIEDNIMSSRDIDCLVGRYLDHDNAAPWQDFDSVSCKHACSCHSSSIIIIISNHHHHQQSSSCTTTTTTTTNHHHHQQSSSSSSSPSPPLSSSPPLPFTVSYQ